MKETLTKIDRGLTFTGTQVTVEKFAKAFLEGKELSRRPQTVHQYRQIFDLHILPTIGKMRLQDIQPTHLKQLYLKKKDEGRGARTVQLIHSVMHTILNQAMKEVTTLHWGEARVEGCRALRDSGYKALAGYFEFEDGKPVVSYYLDADKTEHIGRRGIWCDNSEGIIFKKINMVINLYKHEEIIPLLDQVKKDPHNSAFIDLMIHEQYFYPYYIAYQPDFREKVLTAVKWASDNGYQPAFLSESLFD